MTSLNTLLNNSKTIPENKNIHSLELSELPSNGSQSVKLKAPDSLAADYTLTLPTDDGTSNQVLKTDGSGVLSWTAQSSALNNLSDVTYANGDLTISGLDKIVTSNDLIIGPHRVTIEGASASSDDPIFVVNNTSTSNGEPTMEVRGAHDCSLRIEGAGGEAFIEISNTAGSGHADESWGIGCDDDRDLSIGWGTNHTLNKTFNMILRENKGDQGTIATRGGFPNEDDGSDIDQNRESVRVLGDLRVTGGIGSFTGSHLCIGNSLTTSHIGLLCESTNNIVNLDNVIDPTTNESLPIVKICSIEKSKKVFGVLSNISGPLHHTNTNENRCHINSLGEGAIWITNKNDNIEIGDYITSSSIPGYGQKQTETQLHNFTAAKSLSDCPFSLTKINKQKLKVTTSTQTTSKGTITLTTLDLDASDNVQFEDDLDSSGNIQLVYPFETRFLLSDGTQITESEYTTRLGNSESVYITCFVGCTYHCG